MGIGSERLSRAVAVGALLSSAAFFAWYGLAFGASWPAMLPFYGGAVLMWMVAAAGVERRRPWGPSFAAGLSAISVLTMLRAGLHPAVTLFLSGQVILFAALAARAVAERQSGAEPEPEQWRHAGLGFAAGIAAPWLLIVGLLPGLGCGASMLGLGAAALGAAGIGAAFRGRTWGLFAMAAAVLPLLAIPASGVGCMAGLHDGAGELASIALGLALLPWAGPVVRRLRG